MKFNYLYKVVICSVKRIYLSADLLSFQVLSFW